MLHFIPALSVFLLEMLIAYIAFSYLGERRFSVPLTVLIGAALFASGAAVNLLFANTFWINAFYSAVINFLFAFFCFRLALRPALLYAVLMDLLSIAFESATIFLVSALKGVTMTHYNSDLTTLAIETGISKTLYFIACLLLLRLSKRKGESLERIPLSFLAYPACTLAIFMVLWTICASEPLAERNQILLSVVSLVLIFSTVLLFLTYRHNLEQDSEYIRMKSELGRLQTEKTYYEILEHQDEELRLYAHDAKKHLAAIADLNHDPRIAEYLAALSDQLKSHANSCHSGNKILDVMLNRTTTECALRGVAFDYDVKLCNLAGMEDLDIVAILGNLLDNALAAAGKSEKKHVSLSTLWRNAYRVIILSNSCDAEPISRGGELITTKQDRKLHGYGLKSVKRTLKKYSGDYEWDYDAAAKLFTVTVMIGEKG
ncbi:MAG: sensor histidine kinase [Ruminococcus sp.]|nr:sensor histidine kinase [Ruminococcus sp.]